MIDVKETLGKAEEKMEEAVMYLEETLAHIRAGKANVKILDGIRVDSYGSMVPLNQVAAVVAPDPRTITIKPWDKSMFRPIEKAIMDSNVGITPENNGEIIRLGIPPLTEERRKQLAKQCGKEGEQAKVSIRNTRREIIEKLKKGVKDGLSEDLEKDAEGDMQKMHDKFIKKVDELLRSFGGAQRPEPAAYSSRHYDYVCIHVVNLAKNSGYKHVQGPGTYSRQYADLPLLAIPTSCRRVAACSPN